MVSESLVTRGLLLLTLLAVPLTVSGCAATTTPSEKSHSVDIRTMELPADVSAQGVLLAAVLLSTADIEGALAEGLVTPAEVDFAQQAIDDRMLDHWRERAEAELSGK